YLSISGSLSSYANQAVRVRFVFGSDDATNDLGWFIDDVAIDDVQEPGPCNVPCTSDPVFAGLPSASVPFGASCAVHLACGAPAFSAGLEPAAEPGYTRPTPRLGGTFAVTSDPTAHSANEAWVVLDDQPGAPNNTYRDDTLTLPPLSLTATSVMTFWHNYDFARFPTDTPDTAYRSGAVIEISRDGSTWTDLGADAQGNDLYIAPPN